MSFIKYKIYKNSSSAGVKGKFYARAYHDETIDLEEIAEHMSNHNTPYSKGTIHGVLKDMVSCVKELLLDSKKVKLDDLAIFSLGLTSKPSDSAAEFSPSSHIVKAYINAMGTGEVSKKQLDVNARFKEVVEYSRNDSGETHPGSATNTPPADNPGGGSAGGGSTNGQDGGSTGGSTNGQTSGNSGGGSNPNDENGLD